MNHQNEPFPTDPPLSHSLFIGMQVAPETELACTPWGCNAFGTGYWVAPEPADITAEEMSLLLDMDQSNIRDLIYAILVSVFRNEKRFALEAVRRGTTVDQLSVAAIAQVIRRHTRGRMASPGIDWAGLGDQIYALLIEVLQHKKQFAQNARRRNLTPEQHTAAQRRAARESIPVGRLS